MTLPATMAAVLMTGHGGFDMLDYRTDVPVPTPSPGEVLIRVAAAGINNTDINTRIGWYSKAVTTDTGTGGVAGFDQADDDDATWSGTPMVFPRIQGADVCGQVAAVGQGVDESRIGERVIVRSLFEDPTTERPFHCWTYGSEVDGGFAQFAIAGAVNTYAVASDLSDVELAAIPCAYSTAENMLHRADLEAEKVLITGASGGVGSAAVQLAKRRGAHVTAVCSSAKAADVMALGADQVVDRDADLADALGRDSIDVVIDLVAGPKWPGLLDVLRRGGRYAVAGAIAGPMVGLDVRTLYLKDLTFFGCTFQDRIVFENLVRYIEAGELHPVVAHSYPLRDIVMAQQDFLSKAHTGKLVLIPPTVT